jgi:sulfofructose kinase
MQEIMNKRFDVLGLGAVAIDDLLILDEFPKPDNKYTVRVSERHAGGLTGTALVAAAKMGCSTVYAGTLGADEGSAFIERKLREAGVSTDHIVRRDETRPFHSTILIDNSKKTRTILADALNVVGADSGLPSEEFIRSVGVLFVDHVGLEGMIRASLIARDAGIPIVADFESRHPAPFDQLFSLADHLILPLDFALELSGAGDGKKAALDLWDSGRNAVVVTVGAEGSWYMSSEDPGKVHHQSAFPVEVADTTGCGDVFHGAYAAGLRKGMPMAGRIRFASAVAALKATHIGGQEGIPSLGEVEAFLKARN